MFLNGCVSMFLSQMCPAVALLDDVSLILDLAAGAQSLLHREAAASSPVPAPLLDGEGVGAEAQARPSDTVYVIHCVNLLIVRGMD